MKKFILALVVLAAGASAAFAQSENDFRRNMENETVTIVFYTGSVKDVVIPPTIAGIPVTRIAPNAFSLKGLTSVIIPESVTFIGGGAFDLNSKLTRIVIGANVELVTDVFGAAFDNNFIAYYNRNGKKAGTYTLTNKVWSYRASVAAD